MKFLMVEDDRDLAQSYVEIFDTFIKEELLIVHGLAELQAKKDQLLSCDVAFLDINLGFGKPNGLDVFRWLIEENFRGKIYFLTGHARSHPLVQKACDLSKVKVLVKPMGLQEFIDLVNQIKANP